MKQAHGPFSTFTTVCPKCEAEGELYVVYAAVSCKAPLCEDGYLVDGHILNTEEEVVECQACEQVYGITDLMWENMETELDKKAPF